MSKRNFTKLIGLAMLAVSTLSSGNTASEVDLCTRFISTTHTTARSLQWSTYSKEEKKLASAIRRYVIDNSRAKGISDCKIQDELTEIREDGERYLRKDCDLLSLCR